jgi:hypothetical protein
MRGFVLERNPTVLTRPRIIGAVAATLALVSAPPAFAGSTSISLDTRLDHTSVLKVSSGPAADRVEVRAGQTPIAEASAVPGSPGTFGDIELPVLSGMPSIRVYAGPDLLVNAEWIDLPGAEATCAGISSFLALRGDWFLPIEAGVYPAGATEPLRGTIQDPRSRWFTVLLNRPIAAGDVLYAVTQRTWTEANGENVDVTSKGRTALSPVCADKPPLPWPTPTPTPTPTPAAPTNAQVRAAVDAALVATGKKLRTLKVANRQSVALPFRFPEAGRVDLRLLSGKTVLGRGHVATVAAGQARIAVKFTAAGRKLLKRSKHPRLTLTAGFNPTRSGASAQTSTIHVKR